MDIEEPSAYTWFRRGQMSVKRKNKSGCCCIIDDGGNVVSACDAHREWLEKKLEELKPKEKV